MTGHDEFYIGWEEKAPAGVGSRVRRIVVLMLGLSLGLGAVLSLAQRTIGLSVFEWGQVKNFSGILRSQPYPHLLVARPGASGDQAAFSSYYLVSPFKFGLDVATANRLDGKAVSLKGTLIYRGGQTMVEVVSDSIKPAEGPGNGLSAAPAGSPVSLGRRTFVGEIVDSKCYLGVMNPGALAPHRACAIRCISGGIPPVLLVRQSNSPALYLLLVSREGKPVNKQVLNLVAEPVEISGDVEGRGNLLILRADPATYRRVTGY
jgi:hypothetical protein